MMMCLTLQAAEREIVASMSLSHHGIGWPLSCRVPCMPVTAGAPAAAWHVIVMTMTTRLLSRTRRAAAAGNCE